MPTPQPIDLDRDKWRTRPSASPVMFQTWRDLLFLHWQVDPDIIQNMLPRGLTVDTWDGAAWLGVVPFAMRNIRPSWAFCVPHISNFLELNVRTYAVDEHGTPGVWFISLSANRRLAVWLGRSWFRLPYVRAAIKSRKDENGGVNYHCRRFDCPERRACEFHYRRVGSLASAVPDTLDHFLVERYVLFSRMRDSRIATGRVHHVPYQFQPVELTRWSEEILLPDGLPLPARAPDHAVFSPGVDVEVFGLRIGE